MEVSNPMLALGSGPEGAFCRQCRHFQGWTITCGKREGQERSCSGRWQACMLFEPRPF
jgi:hypothetical protein